MSTSTIPILNSQVVVLSPSSLILNGDDFDNILNLSKINNIDFGPLAPGETSYTAIMYLNIANATQINNIQIGLTNIGNLDFLTSSFGVDVLNYLDYNYIPKNNFQGINPSKNINSPFNIPVPNGGSNISQYVYLNISVANTLQFNVSGTVRYKWFFSYGI